MAAHHAAPQRGRPGGARYDAPAGNLRHPAGGRVEAAEVVHGSPGRADRLDRAARERRVRGLRRVPDADAGEPAADAPGRDQRIEIEASSELGVVHVVEQLRARPGIGRAGDRRPAGGRAARLAADERRAPHGAALPAMVAQRSARPGSELARHERWPDRVWLPPPAAGDLALDQLDRALDVLAEHGDAIEREVFGHTASTCSSSTSTWSSATPPPPGSNATRRTSPATSGAARPSRRCASVGAPRKGRDNDPQAIVALAVTRDGMPVRSWVLPGDTADVTAVARIIKGDLRRMRLGRALSVGDAGLYARANPAEPSRGAGRHIPPPRRSAG